MVLFVVASVVVLTALSVHHYHWRRGASGQYVLVALPAALLFLILPIPFVMFRTIRGFQQIAAQQSNSYSTAAALSLEINRALWIGTLGVLIAMLAAAALQWRAANQPSDDADAQPRTWREWVLLGCAVVVVPTALLAYTAAEVPRAVIGVMERMTGVTPGVPSSDLGNLSGKIAGLLVAGFIGGLTLAIVDVLAAAGTVLLASGIRQPRRLPRAGWVVLAIVLLGAAWNAVQLPVERRWIERVAASAVDRHS